jgi:hypothetical protein
MNTETQQHEKHIALAWHIGTYTQDQAEYSAGLQGLSFDNIVNEFARLESLGEVA